MTISETLLEQIAGAAGHSEFQVLLYSDGVASDALWAALENDRPLHGASNLVIVFDDFPKQWKTEHPFRPELWLTPWDWALAMSTLFLRDPKRLPHAGFRCWIVDLLPAAGELLARQRFKMAQAFVPWVRSYRPLEASPRTTADDIWSLWKDLPGMTLSPALDAIAAADSSSRGVSSVWLNLLAAPGDRHAIGNLVGPLLLAEGVRRTMGRDIDLRVDTPTLHFRALLRAVGFATAEKNSTSRITGAVVDHHSVLTTIEKDLFQQNRKVRWLLVDDHASLGYHAALAGLLFGVKSTADTDPLGDLTTTWNGDARDLSLRSVSHPIVLLNELKTSFGRQPNWTAPRVLGQSVFDILLLDLRLFPKSTTESASQEERSFLAALLGFCKTFGSSLPNDDGLRAAMAAAQRRYQGGREELAALTLLPLLLSHADPSLPIILFSSSHQHEVARAFADRPNVIASFSKPIMTGYAHSEATSLAVDELVLAVTDSIRLHRVRPVWQAIARLSEEMAGRDWPITEKRLLVDVWDHQNKRKVEKPFNLRLEPGLVGRLQLEFANLLVRGRFADALMAPHNILEYSRIGSDEFVPPDANQAPIDFMEVVADLQFYRVLEELRNARAHYQCQPIRDDEALEQPAYWTWFLFIQGCRRLVRGEHPIVPGRDASDSPKIERARKDWLLPLVKGTTTGPGKLSGFKRSRQIIGKFGTLLNEELLEMPGEEFGQLVAYAKHMAKP